MSARILHSNVTPFPLVIKMCFMWEVLQDFVNILFFIKFNSLVKISMNSQISILLNGYNLLLHSFLLMLKLSQI